MIRDRHRRRNKKMPPLPLSRNRHGRRWDQHVDTNENVTASNGDLTPRTPPHHVTARRTLKSPGKTAPLCVMRRLNGPLTRRRLLALKTPKSSTIYPHPVVAECRHVRFHRHRISDAAIRRPLADLQVNFYKEIGISALAAALHVMAKPIAPKDVAASDGRAIPAILQSDDLAA